MTTRLTDYGLEEGCASDGGMTLTDVQRLKLRLFEQGMRITRAADSALREATEGDELTPADYASTSGLILRLDSEVWVNAPVVEFNPNFVGASDLVLDHDGTAFCLSSSALRTPAEFWPPPSYHGSTGRDGRPINEYVFTHGDRARLAPIRGCRMKCTFCDIPYEDVYALKSIEPMLEAISAAVTDARQPARHLLISGGTPSSAHVPFLRQVYREVLEAFPHLPVDIMMVPVPGLFDLAELDRLGVNELSINLEVFDETIAADVMPQKHRQGRRYYLDFITEASRALGTSRVRSMLMVGLESHDSTLEGVEAIAKAGGTPVLSAFRPDPNTPLASLAPPSAAALERAYLDATAVAEKHGVALGPSCAPCTHNTLSFGSTTPLVPHLV